MPVHIVHENLVQFGDGGNTNWSMKEADISVNIVTKDLSMRMYNLNVHLIS